MKQEVKRSLIDDLAVIDVPKSQDNRDPPSSKREDQPESRFRNNQKGHLQELMTIRESKSIIDLSSNHIESAQQLPPPQGQSTQMNELQEGGAQPISLKIMNSSKQVESREEVDEDIKCSSKSEEKVEEHQAIENKV